MELQESLQSLLYLCRSILVLAATGIGVSQGTIAISLNVPATLALLHRIGDGTLGVSARLDFYALLRPSPQIAATINWYLVLCSTIAIRRN